MSAAIQSALPGRVDAAGLLGTGAISTGRTRIDSLDAIRALAALGVCVYHLSLQGTLFQIAWLNAVFGNGDIGVPVFFVISGFVIPYAMASSGYRVSDFFVFLAKRLVRLEPPYIVAIALAIAFWLRFGYNFGDPPKLTLENFLLHFGYLVGIAKALGESVDWYVPAFWTLQFEFQFYVAVAVCHPVIVGARREVRVGVVLGLLACQGLLKVSPAASFPLFVAFADLFALGIVICHRMCGLSGRLEFLALAGVCMASIALRWPSVLWWGPALCAVILYRADLGSWMARLGRCSYSLYLYHGLVGLWVLHTLLNRGVPAAAAFSLALAASVLFSAVVAFAVERPAVMLASRIGYNHRPGRQATAAGASSQSPDGQRSAGADDDAFGQTGGHRMNEES